MQLKRKNRFILGLAMIFIFSLLSCTGIEYIIKKNQEKLMGTWEAKFEDEFGTKKEILIFDENGTVTQEIKHLGDPTKSIPPQSGNYIIYANNQQKPNFQGLLLLKFENSEGVSVENHCYFGFIDKNTLQLTDELNGESGISYTLKTNSN